MEFDLFFDAAKTLRGSIRADFHEDYFDDGSMKVSEYATFEKEFTLKKYHKYLDDEARPVFHLSKAKHDELDFPDGNLSIERKRNRKGGYEDRVINLGDASEVGDSVFSNPGLGMRTQHTRFPRTKALSIKGFPTFPTDAAIVEFEKDCRYLIHSYDANRPYFIELTFPSDNSLHVNMYSNSVPAEKLEKLKDTWIAWNENVNRIGTPSYIKGFPDDYKNRAIPFYLQMAENYYQSLRIPEEHLWPASYWENQFIPTKFIERFQRDMLDWVYQITLFRIPGTVKTSEPTPDHIGNVFIETSEQKQYRISLENELFERRVLAANPDGDPLEMPYWIQWPNLRFFRATKRQEEIDDLAHRIMEWKRNVLPKPEKVNPLYQVKSTQIKKRKIKVRATRSNNRIDDSGDTLSTS